MFNGQKNAMVQSESLESIEGQQLEELWRAVKERDPEYYSSFVYAVKSTGIYCRPTCPSRRPRPDQAVFFANPSAAEKAGFRACLRCKPNDPDPRSPQEILVGKICDLVDENPEADLSLNDLGRTLNLSPFYVQRIFKKVTGITPKEYVRASRIQKIKQSLKRGESIRKSIYDSGYNTSSFLYTQSSSYDSVLGMRPSSYKAGGEGMKVSYLVSDSPVGRLLVAGTESGICAVMIGNSNERMIKTLNEEFPKADIVQDERIVNNLGAWVEKILDCLNSGKNLASSGVPLDVIGTAFQHRVWKELQAIPLGEVMSYSEVAKRIGEPKATRAVARACATNPACLVIPCHRVVSKSGDLGGYRWGIDKKKHLLGSEGVSTPKRE